MSRSPDDHYREYRGSRNAVKREPESRDEYIRSASSSRRDQKGESRRYDSVDEYESRRVKQEENYSGVSYRSRDDGRLYREREVPREESQHLSRSIKSAGESQRFYENKDTGESRKKKSPNYHKRGPQLNKTHESPRTSRWDQSMEENQDGRYSRNREISRESKRSRLYRKDQEIRPPLRVKLEVDNDVQIVDCSDNKLRTQKRRLEKKRAQIQPPAAPAVIDLDDEPVAKIPPPPPPPPPLRISQPPISVIPQESLSLEPVRKFDSEYIVPEDNFQSEAPMDTQYSDCIQAVAFGDEPLNYHQPQVQESPAPQFFQPPQHLEQPRYVPHQQVATERFFIKQQFTTRKQEFIQQQPIQQQQFVQQPPIPNQKFIQPTTVPRVEFYEEEDQKPFSNFPSVQIQQVVQVPFIASSKVTSHDIQAVCKSCGMTFIHSCKYPPSTVPNSMFLEPGRLKKCQCTVIFLHTRQQCQQTITKGYVQSKNETSMMKQVNRIHKYQCYDCEFKCTIEGIRASSHYFESMTRKDGTVRDKGKKIERELQPMLRKVDDIARKKYPNEPPSVQKTHVDIRRCLISVCNQSCCVLYHECPPKPSSAENDDDV